MATILNYNSTGLNVLLFIIIALWAAFVIAHLFEVVSSRSDEEWLEFPDEGTCDHCDTHFDVGSRHDHCGDCGQCFEHCECDERCDFCLDERGRDRCYCAEDNMDIHMMWEKGHMKGDYVTCPCSRCDR